MWTWKRELFYVLAVLLAWVGVVGFLWRIKIRPVIVASPQVAQALSAPLPQPPTPNDWNKCLDGEAKPAGNRYVVKIHNHCLVAMNQVLVQFKFLDADGDRIGWGHETVGVLEPGETSKFWENYPKDYEDYPNVHYFLKDVAGVKIFSYSNSKDPRAE